MNYKYCLKKEFINSLRKEYKDCQIAEMLEVDKTTISNVFSNRRQPSKDLIYKICIKLHKFPSEFIKIKK